jgi:hypothetical protein
LGAQEKIIKSIEIKIRKIIKKKKIETGKTG